MGTPQLWAEPGGHVRGWGGGDTPWGPAAPQGSPLCPCLPPPPGRTSPPSRSLTPRAAGPAVWVRGGGRGGSGGGQWGLRGVSDGVLRVSPARNEQTGCHYLCGALDAGVVLLQWYQPLQKFMLVKVGTPDPPRIPTLSPTAPPARVTNSPHVPVSPCPGSPCPHILVSLWWVSTSPCPHIPVVVLHVPMVVPHVPMVDLHIPMSSWWFPMLPWWFSMSLCPMSPHPHGGSPCPHVPTSPWWFSTSPAL